MPVRSYDELFMLVDGLIGLSFDDAKRVWRFIVAVEQTFRLGRDVQLIVDFLEHILYAIMLRMIFK